MNRRTFYWKLRTSELALGERTLIMGVLNVTPDSFSDGGLFRDPERAYARALELEEQGADIIDIGAESTRPGSSRISADEEWQRLVPVLKRLRGNLRVPLSLDTYKSEIATRAMDYGVEIINDPSGLTFDSGVAKAAAAANAGLILNHMRGTPESWAKLAPLPDAPSAIARDLEAMVNRARRAGVEQNRIVIDPGLGFGKRGEQNSEILAHLGELVRLELPILVGVSRKSFLRQKSDEETIFATAAAVAAAILKGAHIVRVHDVKEMRAVALVTDEIARAAAVLRVTPERQTQRPKVARPPIREGVGRNEQRPPRPPLLRRPDPEPAREDRPPRREDFARTKPPQKSERDFRRGPAGPPRDREFRGGDTERTQRGRPAGDRPRDPGRKDWRGDRSPRPAPGNRDRSGPPRRPEGEGGPPRDDQRKGGRPPKRVFRKRP